LDRVRLDRGRLGDRRNEDAETGAMTRPAGGYDDAAMRRDDAMHGGETEAGALADLLGGEERLEHALHGARIHAATGVTHLDAEILHTRLQRCRRQMLSVVQHAVRVVAGRAGAR